MLPPSSLVYPAAKATAHDPPWAEIMTGLPLTTAMCDLLENGGNNDPVKCRSTVTDVQAQGAAPGRILELGRHTVSLPTTGHDEADTPQRAPTAASHVWAEERDGALFVHMGDFVDEAEMG